MSKLTKKDLHTPFNNTTLRKVFQHIMKLAFNQLAPANQSLTPLGGPNPWNNDAGVLRSLTFFSSKSAGAGESMVVDVQVLRASGGSATSILSAPYTFNSTKSPGVQLELPVATTTTIYPGDVLEVSYAYTAGAGTMGASRVQAEIS